MDHTNTLSETNTNHEHAMHNMHAEHHEGGHDKHAGHHTADFWKRFIVCTIISIPVLALSHMIQQWLFYLRWAPILKRAL